MKIIPALILNNKAVFFKTREFGSNKVLLPQSVVSAPLKYTPAEIISFKDEEGKLQNYRFRLWTVEDKFQTSLEIEIGEITEVVNATAWYERMWPPGELPTKNFAIGSAFSLDSNTFIPKEDPFETVNPPDGWPVTFAKVETTDYDVNIKARETIEVQAKVTIPIQHFVEWFAMIEQPHLKVHIKGPKVTIMHGNSMHLIAKYTSKLEQKLKPQPPPNQKVGPPEPPPGN